ncbi:hypothetical protein RND81_10G139400 [Saponaria officinalis]|uniref:DUF674 family protein n=1 Tax=Saponaria officinalis TaxID=3572 RepID=A0AAW1I1T1_SAPOF
MAETSEKKLSLKIMVDRKANKVVFVEANEEFVNFIISLMSLPLSSVTKVLLQNEKGAAGSLGNIYKSIESLDELCFEKVIDKASVLKPRVTVTLPLLSLHELPVSACKVFQCGSCLKTSNVEATICCKYEQEELQHTCIASKKPTFEFVRRGAYYMVTDSLDIKPMSIEFIPFYAKGIDVLVQKQVEVGLQERLAILKASLKTTTVLTTVFLRKI